MKFKKVIFPRIIKSKKYLSKRNFPLLFLLPLFIILSDNCFAQKLEILPKYISIQKGKTFQFKTNPVSNNINWKSNCNYFNISTDGTVSTDEKSVNSKGKVYICDIKGNNLDSAEVTIVNWTTNMSVLNDIKLYNSLYFLGHKNDSIFTYKSSKPNNIFLSYKNLDNLSVSSTITKIKSLTDFNILSNSYGYIYRDSIYTYYSKDMINWSMIYKTKAIQLRNSMCQRTDLLNNSQLFFWGDYSVIDSISPFVYRGEIKNNKVEIKPVYRFFSRTEFQKDKNNYPKARHVHTTRIDPFTNDLWIGTGDFDEECYLMYSCDNGDNFQVLGTGSQDWRTLSIWFTENYIYWTMDAAKDQKIMRISREIYKSNNNKWPSITPVLTEGYTKPGIRYFIKTNPLNSGLPNKTATFFTETISRKIENGLELIPTNDKSYDYRQIVAKLENSAFWYSMPVFDNKGDKIELLTTDAEGTVLDDYSRIFGLKEREDGTLDIQELYKSKGNNRYAQMMPCLQNSDNNIFTFGYYTDWKIHKMELDWKDNSESIGGVVKEDDNFIKLNDKVKLKLTDYDGEIQKWQIADKSMQWTDIEYKQDTLTILKQTGTYYYRAIVKKENQPPVSSVPAEVKSFIWTDSASTKNPINRFNITPVPARDYLIVNGLDISDDILNFELFNIEGSCIVKKSLIPQSKLINETINLPNLSNGVYMVRINGAISFFTKKIIINK
jgi:hypothetical protein